jgi:hypothetical protein
MKWMLPGLCCFALALSCTRTNQSNSSGNQDAAGRLDSFIVYVLGPKEINRAVNKLNYDDNGRLVEIYTTDADTTPSQEVYLNTSTIRFTYTGTDSIPSGYTQTEDSQGGLVDVPHFLTYDAQRSITADSEWVNDYNYHKTDRYQYGDGWISRITEEGSDRMNTQYSLDSFFLQGGDVIRFSDHSAAKDPGGQYIPGSQNELQYLTYSAYPNPIHLPVLGDHLGPVFSTEMSVSNLLSQNMPGQIKNLQNNDQFFTLNYSWATDDKGRVVSGTGTNADTGETLEYYTYIYKN